MKIQINLIPLFNGSLGLDSHFSCLGREDPIFLGEAVLSLSLAGEPDFCFFSNPGELVRTLFSNIWGLDLVLRSVRFGLDLVFISVSGEMERFFFSNTGETGLDLRVSSPGSSGRVVTGDVEASVFSTVSRGRSEHSSIESVL